MIPKFVGFVNVEHEPIVRLAWGVPEGEDAPCWYESPRGHTWGIFDQTWGMMPTFHLKDKDVLVVFEVNCGHKAYMPWVAELTPMRGANGDVNYVTFPVAMCPDCGSMYSVGIPPEWR